MGLLKLMLGKFRSWKTQLQLMWFLVAFGGALFLYGHLMSSQPLLAVHSEEIQAHRVLHSLNQEKMDHEAETFKHQQRVTFVSENNSQSVIDSERSNSHGKSGGGGEALSTLSTQEKHKNAIKILERRIVEQSKHDRNKMRSYTNKHNSPDTQSVSRQEQEGSTETAQRNPNIYSGNAASAWNGGSFRYNPYGEPVYSHGNRPNYIPKERVVHLDLKGAPPLPSVYKTLIPWLAKHGATGILMEYEDMFPWEGSLSSLAAKNHYSKEDIREISELCKQNQLELIPLVQTFGHLEFALKLQAYAYLREVPDLPQALCPSQNDSQILVRAMIDQIMTLHPDAKNLHIGCDEVFQMGECSKCRLKTRENIFLSHVSATAYYVKSTYRITPIIWHDMLTHISEAAMKDYKFGELAEPMVWVYAEDVYRFVQPSMWTRLSQIFPTVWAASAFKGAFGEQSTVPNVRRHLDNNQNWLDVMSSESSKFEKGFRGLTLTGWQRHDHFAVLCELIPAALPSLAVNLITTSHGYLNDSVYAEIYESLKCIQNPKYQTWLNLDSDPFLWDKFAWCLFPGDFVFKSTARLEDLRKDVRSYIERVTLKRGWITDYNRRHNFSSPMRIEEDLEELPSKIHATTQFMKSITKALLEWFDEFTTGEWTEQHLWPLLNDLETLQRESESMKLVKTWPVRPLPLLPQLEAFGITDPNKAPVREQSLKNFQEFTSRDNWKKSGRTIRLK